MGQSLTTIDSIAPAFISPMGCIVFAPAYQGGNYQPLLRSSDSLTPRKISTHCSRHYVEQVKGQSGCLGGTCVSFFPVYTSTRRLCVMYPRGKFHLRILRIFSKNATSIGFVFKSTAHRSPSPIAVSARQIARTLAKSLFGANAWYLRWMNFQ